MDRGYPWNHLHRRETPVGILSLISALYTNTESAIKSRGDISHIFSVKSGARKGWFFARTPFSTYIDWENREMVGKLIMEYHGDTMITDIAGDVVIFAETS